ncbi:hypothetical protein MTR67_022495 [Solanum verrucosum]|uniref:Uncharacterized protein n=1 Tax=Solanum verrucosum TaxID=315347 RepID=A0AAF0TWS6_SOLVR|nr:hypothetical protein MTR67_022495 [Solanum verrucosum]
MTLMANSLETSSTTRRYRNSQVVRQGNGDRPSELLDQKRGKQKPKEMVENNLSLHIMDNMGEREGHGRCFEDRFTYQMELY